MPQCSAPKCKNRGIHIFPKDPIRRKRWENALRINNFKASDTARLCASHFKEDDYFGKSNYTGDVPLAKFLKKTAVPSIFYFTIVKQETPAALERQQRYEQRSKRKLFVHNDVKEHMTRTELSVTGPKVSHMTPDVGCEEEVHTTMEITVPLPCEIVLTEQTPDVGCEEEVHTTMEITVPLPCESVLTEQTPDVGCEEEVHMTTEITVPLPCESVLTEPKCSSKSTQIDHEHIYGSINRYKNDNKSILFYTGFETYKKFHFVYSTLSPMAHKIRYFSSNVIGLSTEDQFFLTLMKLRQNKCIFELSKFFNISETTVSNIFITWINLIYQLWSTLNIWPRKELVQYNMPEHFKKYDENVRVILDGTEITVQKPKNPTSQQASWSSYKHANTLKVLVGATPGGLLSYCSQAYAGSISDRQTVERSGLMSKCESGDSVLADRGFTIQDMFADKNITVKIPTFLKGKSQLPGLTIIKDRELASKRVHIERIIGLTKTYKILKSELDHSYIPIASKIFFVCFMCCNFRECIMKQK